jgi:hypothetical protein
MPVLDAVQELVDHSLLRPLATSGVAPRYAMLETVREFAAERLADLSCATAVYTAHAAAFSNLASDLARPPCWPDKPRLDQLELEHDNFRAALDWYGREESTSALRLANKLTAFWSARGHFSEGRQRLRDLLELVPSDDVSARVDALNGAAWLAIDQGDRATAIRLLDQSVGQAHAAQDPVAEGIALFYRGRAKFVVSPHSTPAGGESDLLQALELLTMADDRAGMAATLMLRALIPMSPGRLRLRVSSLNEVQRCLMSSASAQWRREPGSCLESRAWSRGTWRGLGPCFNRPCLRLSKSAIVLPSPSGCAPSPGSQRWAGGRAVPSRWPELRRRTRRSTRPTDPSRCGPTSKVGWHRLARRLAARRRGSSTKADE